jgi:hypothetical protein
MTAVSSAIFTAPQFNLNVRDNLLETAPAKAAIANQYFTTNATNAIVSNRISSATVSTSQSTTSTTFTDLATAGPSVTITTSTRALVIISAEMTKGSGDTAASTARASIDVSGATTILSGDDIGLCRAGPNRPFQYSRTVYYAALTAGSNTFKMVYRVSSGTGTFSNREIIVMPF